MDLEFQIVATSGTRKGLLDHGIKDLDWVLKVYESRPHVIN